MALVIALSGGAYAASGGLTGKQKKEVTKIAKKFAGKPGPRGKQGSAGATGATGAAGVGSPGPKGQPGADGQPGEDGQPGADGKSVVVGAATVGECAPGGATVQVAGEPSTKKAVCNGAKGEKGDPGAPWPGPGTLPPLATETGVWGTVPSSPAGIKTFPISFPIPLAAAPQVIIVKFNEESKPGCPGRGGGTFTEGYEPTIPQADPGKLCIYEMLHENGEIKTPLSTIKYAYNAPFEEWEAVAGASNTGTLINATCPGICSLAGTWAVTAPEE